ncbi:GNAT family N-acetyltransferase [Pseudoflavonifractor capillosus]|uniref:GNAT family N-acetyltransferase n=1 Tax=Pseudoflavonifractor capillosus TaxID=106588 RepID=UPI001A9C4A18|nr:GNAT family N-acetyltransferase [Pseudoflavonifractor capillosus]
MITLVEPCERYLQSYIEAHDEYEIHGVETYAFDNARAYNIFKKYDNCREERNLPPNRVGSHFYWLVDEERNYFIGEISIRHRLTDSLRRYGGHIGYGVRFSEWKKGYGTFMLRLALEKAKQLGISSALITCDDDNYGSAKVMENNGFVLQDKVTNIVNGSIITTRRYTKAL